VFQPSVRVTPSAANLRMSIRHCDPSAPADLLQPSFICRVVITVVVMPFDSQPARPQYLRELLAEVPIGEEDKAQAARS
jgi:hypothetical protein